MSECKHKWRMFDELTASGRMITTATCTKCKRRRLLAKSPRAAYYDRKYANDNFDTMETIE